MDQVIVASSVPSSAGNLPNITYTSGSLENPQIRNAVCDILEGGQRAFLERERRYRLQWEQILEDGAARGTVHFGYGSNLGKSQMKARCPGHSELGRATLQGFKWIINKRGYANVVASPGDVVEGFLYELTAADEAALDRAEGVAKGSYAKHYREVTHGGQTITALIYVDPITEEGTASAEYAGRINTGIHDAKLPNAYVEKYIRRFVAAPAK